MNKMMVMSDNKN